MNKKDIAVVGISCRFPRSEGIRDFWNNLRQGEELIHFFTPEELEASGINKNANDTRHIYARSILEDKGSFDFSFFGYTKDEAAVMDPQIRLMHEYAWKALEDAGCDPYSYPGKIGFFAGVSDNINWMAGTMLAGSSESVDPFFRNILSNKNFSNTLISYKLDLKGPSYFLNTACSTSLVAIHMACRNLLLGECDMAIAAGARVSSSTTLSYTYEEGGIYSKDGHNRTFDAAASGTIEGDGIGVVVLKRLEEALNGNDHIYAVIRSSAVNNDGSRKVGYTAPSSAAQAECIRLAHKLADVRPESITYLEAHGTATRLGDPIEVSALNQVFGNNGKKYCAIGSVKSNMGHLDTAAGIAGFIKTVLALYYNEIPASLHFKQPNPIIDFDGGPFYVNTTLQKWQRTGDNPLRAGVSSFGIGGTNVHVVLEEAPAAPVIPAEEPSHLLLCSARSKTALTRQVMDMQASLSRGEYQPADVAFTLQKRHHSFRYRHYTVFGETHSSRDVLPEKTIHDSGRGKAPIVVFMFSGQGGQYLNMAKGLYHRIPFFKAIIDEGMTMLKESTGTDHLSIIFDTEDPSDMERLHNTLYTQPILFVLEYALARLLMEMKISPALTIGHSIGELTAACISGIFSFQDGLFLVMERARLMSRLPAGAMLAIGIKESEVGPYLNKEVSLAAINGPANCVASGTFAGIEAMAARLRGDGIAAVRLNTSHAFHSSMMDPILDEFNEKIASIPFSSPVMPIVSNLSGRIAGEEILSPHYWTRHIRETVRFCEGIGELAKSERVIFLEIGPGNALTQACRQICRAAGREHTSLNLLRPARETSDDYTLLLQRLGEIWANGVDVHLGRLYKPGSRRIVPLPTYSFDKYYFQAEADPAATVTRLLQESAGTKEEIGDWFYIPGWKRTILLDETAPGYQPCDLLLFSDGGKMSTAFASFLTAKGHHLTEIRKGQDHRRTIESLRLNGQMPGQILYLCAAAETDASGGETFDDAVGDFNHLLDLCNILQLGEMDSPTTLFFITDRLQFVFDPGEQVSLEPAAALGILKVLPQENPAIFCCHLDISFEEERETLLPAIYDELTFNRRHPSVILRDAARWTPAYDQVHLDKRKRSIPVKQNGTYLITGGLGHAGICLAEYLLQHYQANVILTGRSQPATTKLKALHDLEKMPGQVTYYSVDVSEYIPLLQLVEGLEASYGSIDGVIHAAGNTDPANFKPLGLLRDKEINLHFDTKIRGIINLYRIFNNRKPDFVWITSSIASILGGVTYGAYTAANLFMDYFISAKRLYRKNWLSMNLDGLSLRGTSTGTNGIDRTGFIEVFERSFKLAGHPVIAVATENLEKRMDKYIRKKRLAPPPAPTPVAIRPEVSDDVLPFQSLDTSLSPTEKKMVLMWQEFFGVASIGPEDNFFELGGDSLKAMNLSKRIFKEYNIDMPVSSFFTNPYIRALAREIDVAMGLRSLNTASQEVKHRREIKI